jgi:hypothetical protein
MPRHAHYVPARRHPAVLLPFNDDLAIDEKSFRSHLRDVAATKGSSAITINAHSTEVASCSFDEQRRVLEVARTRSATGSPSSMAYGPTAASRRRESPHGGDGGRLRAAGVPAGAVHLGPIAGDGARAFQAHRRRKRSPDHRLPVSARHRPGLSARHAC